MRGRVRPRIRIAREGLALQLAYRRDIDGLRAVAVVFVILFHAFPQVLRAGFIGVDIFFVISGYLISGLIFSALDAKTFSFANFYHRRARRILPALLAVLGASLIAGWLTMTPDEFSALGKHAAAASLFVANWAYWLQAGYFDSAAVLKPLLHIWSLGVEEQFYFFLPPLLWLIYRHRWRLQVVMLVGLASFACNILYIALHRDVSSFFLPQARVWEFLAGTALVLQQRQKHPWFTGYALNNELSSFTGFGLIVASAYFCNNSHYPGFWALGPVAGSVMIIAGGPQAWINRRILSAGPVVFVGLISYSLYLWHWPLLAFPRVIEMGPLSIGTRVGAVALSVALAVLSYRFVELPFRRRPANAATSRTLAVPAVCVLALALIALANIGPTLPVWSLARGESGIFRAVNAWDYPNKRWKPFKAVGRQFYAMASAKKAEALFIGDSDMEQYAPRVGELIKRDPQHVLSAVFATEAGCPPIPGVERREHESCDYMNAAMAYARRSKVQTVAVSARWSVCLGDNDNCYYTDAGPWHGKPLRSDWSKHAFDRLAAFLKELRDSNKEVYLILSIPTGRSLDPQSLFKRSTFSIKIGNTGGASKAALLAEYQTFRAGLRRVAQQSGAIVIDPMAALCVGDRCPAVASDGEAMYRDSTHLSPYFVQDQVTYIDPLIHSVESPTRDRQMRR